MISLYQLMITAGILIAFLSNTAFSYYEAWRWMLGIAALPGAALAVGMLSVPQTPRWLVDAGRDEDARGVLRRLRSGDPDAWRAWWNDPEALSYYFMGKDNITFHSQIWPAEMLAYAG